MRRIRERVVGKQGYEGWIGKAMTKAVKEKQKMRQDLEELGYKFAPANDGTLAYRVTYPDGHTTLADYKYPLERIWQEAEKAK